MNAQQQPKITSDLMRSKMKVPPALAGPYQRVVIAGQKIMFSEQMAPQIQQLMATQDPIGKKIGDGVVALLAMLVDQSNHTFPPQLLIPAGVEFCTDFAQLLRESGLQVSDQDTSVGMQTMLDTVMQKLKVTPEQLAGALQQKGQPQGLVQGAQAQPAAPAAQPPAPAAASPAPVAAQE